MTLKEAHTAWSEQDRIKVFAFKTKRIFERLFRSLFDHPCETLTASILADAIRKATAIKEDKVKGASVVVHVLTFAGVNPAFDYSILTELAEEPKGSHHAKPAGRTSGRSGEVGLERKVLKSERKLPKISQKLPESDQKLPDMKQKKEVVMASPQTKEGDTDRLGRSRNRAPRAVAQIDASTLAVIKVWPKMTAAEKQLGVWGIDRAIKKSRPAGGFYWCNADEVDSFVPAEDRRGRGARGAKTGTAEKPTGTAAKKTADTPSRKRLGMVATSRMEVKEAMVLAAPTTDETPQAETPLTESAGTVEAEQNDAPEHGLAERIGDLELFTDKALIDEIQRRGWKGTVELVIKNMTIKIVL